MRISDIVTCKIKTPENINELTKIMPKLPSPDDLTAERARLDRELSIANYANSLLLRNRDKLEAKVEQLRLELSRLSDPWATNMNPANTTAVDDKYLEYKSAREKLEIFDIGSGPTSTIGIYAAINDIKSDVLVLQHITRYIETVREFDKHRKTFEDNKKATLDRQLCEQLIQGGKACGRLHRAEATVDEAKGFLSSRFRENHVPFDTRQEEDTSMPGMG